MPIRPQNAPESWNQQEEDQFRFDLANQIDRQLKSATGADGSYIGIDQMYQDHESGLYRAVVIKGIHLKQGEETVRLYYAVDKKKPILIESSNHSIGSDGRVLPDIRVYESGKRFDMTWKPDGDGAGILPGFVTIVAGEKNGTVYETREIPILTHPPVVTYIDVLPKISVYPEGTIFAKIVASRGIYEYEFSDPPTSDSPGEE